MDPNPKYIAHHQRNGTLSLNLKETQGNERLTNNEVIKLTSTPPHLRGGNASTLKMTIIQSPY